MQVLVSCDFLIAPASCTDAEIGILVESLIAIKRDLENESSSVLIEDDAINKLSAQNLFPSAQAFNSNLASMGNTDYSGRDIARTVNNILSMHLNKEIAPPYCVADWTNRSLNPNVTGRNMVRTSELNEMFEEVSLAMKIHQRSISFLHHPVAPGAANIEFNGTVESLEPIGTQTIPFDVSVNIPLYQSYKDYLLGLDAYKLYEAAVSDYELKLAIFVGALTALRDRGHHTDLDVWQTFTLGPRFIESLKSHQCYGTQNFASTCFDVLRHVVARLEKYENSPFCTGADRGKQIVRNGQLAWRTHVTKGMQALRLMSWTTSDGSIELANVGNKNALEIF